MRRSSLTLLLLLSATGCSRSTLVRQGPPVIVATPELAKESGFAPWAISMPFGHAQDGSALVLKFLERAEASGARYISNVQVVFMANDAGTELECRTQLMPEGPLPPWKALVRTAMAAGEYAPLQLVSRPMPFVMTVCQQVMVNQTVTQAVRSGVIPSNGGSNALSSRTFTESRPETRCGTATVTRTLTRYAFEDAVNYMPPRIERIVESRPELNLQESVAECLPRDPRAPRTNRIEALAYGGSGPRAAFLELPALAPVEAPVEASEPSSRVDL
ncbi:hypothetical protein HUW62_27025 [Myxococcus sp. AM011]|uniref:hypothetical protein n=1 Tax=Myxococcus sp. AM011 TaxID=2745200 RepID=UPI0015960D46|nr:hypothetical protein [Myxococcus sp. AM011]NVJ24884.1 hypothetical protein [Myxococcus sp. AM011]